MRGFLCLAVAAAGCGGDGVHLEIVVPAGMNVERIDLFLAKGAPCTLDNGRPCDRIAPPRIDPLQVRDPIDGLVFEEDATDPLQAGIDGDSAWFFLSPSHDHVKLMIAIGHDEQGQSIGLAVMANPISLDDGDQYFAAALVPAAAVLGNGTPAVEEWPGDGLPYGCVGAQQDGEMPLFIVPKDDPDCDHVAADRECRPTTFNAQEGASDKLEDASCATLTTACVLGDRGCDETSPMTNNNTCLPLAEARYCVPSAACACTALDDACLQSLIDTSGTVATTHMECRLVYEQLQPNLNRICDGTFIPATITPSSCGSKAELMDLDRDFGRFNNSLALTDGIDTLNVQPILGPSANGCEFSFAHPSDTFGDAFPNQFTGVVKLEMSQNGSADQTFVIVPISIELAPGDCNSERSLCTLGIVQNDKVATCIP